MTDFNDKSSVNQSLNVAAICNSCLVQCDDNDNESQSTKSCSKRNDHSTL